jgi:GTPase KRas protein
MRNGEGFLLVYSITSRMSFEEISTFHQQICRVKDKDLFPMVLVANKSDLESERQVSSQEGRDLAKQYGCHYIETSAKLRVNVDQAFHQVVRDIRRYNKEQDANNRASGGNGGGGGAQHDRFGNQGQSDDATSKCCILM